MRWQIRVRSCFAFPRESYLFWFSMGWLVFYRNTIPFDWKSSAYIYHSIGLLASHYFRSVVIPCSLYINDRHTGANPAFYRDSGLRLPLLATWEIPCSGIVHYFYIDKEEIATWTSRQIEYLLRRRAAFKGAVTKNSKRAKDIISKTGSRTVLWSIKERVLQALQDASKTTQDVIALQSDDVTRRPESE